MATNENGLPAFEARAEYPHGVLPEGVHSCGELVFEEHFVQGFPRSTTRKEICDGLFRLRADSMAVGLSAIQWIDGSFVESKENPNDVDAVTFVDRERLNAAIPEAKAFVSRVLSGEGATKGKYHTHAFFVAACLPMHAYFPVFEQMRAYWRKWLGETYDKSNADGDGQVRHRKGFVAMPFGNDETVPYVGTERSN